MADGVLIGNILLGHETRNYSKGASYGSQSLWQSIGYCNFDQVGIKFLIMSGLNIDQVGTNNAMTHVMVLK